MSRAEIEFPAGTDPHQSVYERAAQNFTTLKKSALAVRWRSIYTGCGRARTSRSAWPAAMRSTTTTATIKRHERTRRDKEDDRTRRARLGAQTGPVFLTYRASPEINRLVAEAIEAEPIIDFEADDGVRHTLWRVEGANRDGLVELAQRIPFLYIADGHHRAASAARARVEIQQGQWAGTSLGDGADCTILAVAFPDNSVQILLVRGVPLPGTIGNVLDPMFCLRRRFDLERGPATPARRGEIAMYFQGVWSTLRPLVPSNGGDAIGSLDVSLLQDGLLAPVLKITDVRSDTRVEFVGGARGSAELERIVDSGRAAVAFSLFPVAVDDLMAVSDAGAIMPPKSTWFEPKLRDGLLIHVI